MYIIWAIWLVNVVGSSRKCKGKGKEHELGTVEDQAKQTCWSASQQPTYHLQASLCRQRLEPSLHALRQCCQVKILRLQLLTDPNCTHWTLHKDPSHSFSHHHLYPEIKNKNLVKIQIKNNTFFCCCEVGKGKSPLSDKLWRFDLRWEGHQQRENLEQRAPIGENAITREKKECLVLCVRVNETLLFLSLCFLFYEGRG